MKGILLEAMWRRPVTSYDGAVRIGPASPALKRMEEVWRARQTYAQLINGMKPSYRILSGRASLQNIEPPAAGSIDSGVNIARNTVILRVAKFIDQHYV